MTLILRLATASLVFACVSNPLLATDGVVDAVDDTHVQAQKSASTSQEVNPDLPLADTAEKVDSDSTPSSMPVAEKKDDAEKQDVKEEAAKQDASVVIVKPGKDKKTKGCGGGCTLF